jgi:hypothetical protein
MSQPPLPDREDSSKRGSLYADPKTRSEWSEMAPELGEE